MKKNFVLLLTIVVVIILSIMYATKDYFPRRIKAVERYSIEKILSIGSDAAIDKVFDFIEEMEHDPFYKNRGLHAIFLRPYNGAVLVRQEFFFQNLKSGFKGDRYKYEQVAYASWTFNGDYRWDYYTELAPKSLYTVMSSAREHIMTAGKTYFSDPANLESFVEAKLPRIIERYNNASLETQSQLKKSLLTVAEYDGVPKGRYEYTGEFLERRRAEGGDELVACYQQVARKILAQL
jgi:hypothetical protein